MRYVIGYDKAALNGDDSAMTIFDAKKRRVLYAGDPNKVPWWLDFWIGLGLVLGYTSIVIEGRENA